MKWTEMKSILAVAIIFILSGVAVYAINSTNGGRSAQLVEPVGYMKESLAYDWRKDVPAYQDVWSKIEEAEENAPYSEYASMKTVFVAPDLNTAVISIKNNSDKLGLSYSEDWYLEKFEDGEWTSAPAIVDGHNVFAIAYNLIPRERTNISIDFTYWYEALVPGEYRVVKDFLVHDPDSVDGSKPLSDQCKVEFLLYAPFTVE